MLKAARPLQWKSPAPADKPPPSIAILPSSRACGPCDVLVNNAGVLRPGPLETLTLGEWNKVLAVNLTGYLLCAQAFGGQMRTHGKGAMVHAASIAANYVIAFSGAYSVAKAGIAKIQGQLS